MGRNLRPWWFAFAISLLLHASLLGGYGWRLPKVPTLVEPLPFEARLMSVPPPEIKPLPRPSAPPDSMAQPAPLPEPVPEPVATPPVPASPVPSAMAETEAAVPPSPIDTPAQAPSLPIQAASVVLPEPTPAAVELPPLNTLPSRVDLRFQVSYGIASGEQTLVWVNEAGKHYTLISVAEATGLAGLFYRGKFVQTSRGRITPRGLVPEEFWDQRGDKRSSAQFDAEQGHLTLITDKGTPRHFTYQGDAQDVLSLFFQLALTAPPAAGELNYTVFNGKKLRDYHYVVRGETRLETAVGPLRTLHLTRVADSDGRFEVWLAIDRHYLPVRVVKSDDKNNEVELKLLSMSP